MVMDFKSFHHETDIYVHSDLQQVKNVFAQNLKPEKVKMLLLTSVVLC